MKRFFLGLSFLAASMTAVNAQDFKLGLHAGIDASNLRLSNISSGPLHYKSGLVGGISLEAKLGPVLSLQLEGNYSRQGASVISDAAGTNALSYNLDYVTIPLLLKMNAVKGLNFYFGPQVGLLLHAETKQIGTPDIDVKELFKSTAYYAVFGTGYQFASGVSVGVRYNFGVNSLLKEAQTGDIKSHYYNFRLGYSFSL
ncbi:MAG: PorT family protein [Chitinophagaceae bacterium]|nr:MAG: PorT family protein [Chitinophagaceae bacterium]